MLINIKLHKEKPAILFVTLLSALYVLRQSYLVNDPLWSITQQLAVCGLLFLYLFFILDFNYFYQNFFFKRSLLKSVTIIILAFSGTMVLFYPLTIALAYALKLVLYLIVTLMAIRFGGGVILRVADAIFLTTLAVIFLGIFNFIESTDTFYSGLWHKFSAGFINPNVPPFFFFSCLAVYYLFGKHWRMFFVLLAIFTCFEFLNLFSRTFLIATIVLMMLSSMKRVYWGKAFQGLLWIQIMLIFSAVLLIFFGFFSSFCNLYTQNFPNYSGEYIQQIEEPVSKNSPYGTYNRPLIFSQNNFEESLVESEIALKDSKLNFILSNRLGVLVDGLYHPKLHKKIVAYDSLFFEYLLILGIPSLYISVRKILTIKKLANKDNFYYRLFVTLFVIYLAGAFEGVLVKFSPISILLMSILLLDIKEIKKIYSLK